MKQKRQKKQKRVVIEDKHMLVKSKKIEFTQKCMFINKTDIMAVEAWEESLTNRGIPYVVVDEGGSVRNSTDRYAIYVEALTLEAYNRVNQELPTGGKNAIYV